VLAFQQCIGKLLSGWYRGPWLMDYMAEANIARVHVRYECHPRG